MRFGYTLEHGPASRPLGAADPLITSLEVDTANRDPELLREELHDWAVAELSRGELEFGLYTAEFGAWRAANGTGHHLRVLYLVWSGEEVLTSYTEDSPVNFAGVRLLTAQAEAFESLLATERRSEHRTDRRTSSASPAPVV
ncbi:hypothetical protein CDG81_06725 [Actinopolyspora erythraea]|uniref:DUF1795 domain-containing protein n=1 Tax=Actinopolyspora erythraea TaxID=414996 RepID=A0A099D399_9ACTN|nr:hypothetical protein [Actinopolyspora erythraea]ASU78052.1 hypothetical protein CDG81_06725 [Actinopolyspora erythraea]KGI79820.1 hypothetical protein IL38_21755 [Actinopolyspora erythraea]